MEVVGTQVSNKNCVSHIKCKLSIVSAFWEAAGSVSNRQASRTLHHEVVW